MRLGLAAGDRLAVDEIDLRVLWPIRGRVPVTPPDGGTGINNVSVVLLGAVGRLPVPAGRRRRGGHRPVAPRRAAPAPRPPQGRPPRQPDGDDAGVRRCGPAAHRDRVGRHRQPVRASGARDARAAGGRRRPRVPDRSRRDGRGDVRAGRPDGRGRGRAGATPRPSSRADDATGARSPSGARSRSPGSCRSARTNAARSRRSRCDRGDSPSVGYHRSDDDPGASGRRLPPAVPGSPGLVRAARAGGRRGRRLPRGPDRRPRDRRRPATGRGRGPAPRRRQDRAAGRSGPRPPPWRRLGGLADPPRAP